MGQGEEGRDEREEKYKNRPGGEKPAGPAAGEEQCPPRGRIQMDPIGIEPTTPALQIPIFHLTRFHENH